ncbi:MAG: hypothetical protein KDB11_33440 [Planctomycetales bacterium]|nr:hypothetical protein [Planctomycetales bacterium]
MNRWFSILVFLVSNVLMAEEPMENMEVETVLERTDISGYVFRAKTGVKRFKVIAGEITVEHPGRVTWIEATDSGKARTSVIWKLENPITRGTEELLPREFKLIGSSPSDINLCYLVDFGFFISPIHLDDDLGEMDLTSVGEYRLETSDKAIHDSMRDSYDSEDGHKIVRYRQIYEKQMGRPLWYPFLRPTDTTLHAAQHSTTGWVIELDVGPERLTFQRGAEARNWSLSVTSIK